MGKEPEELALEDLSATLAYVETYTRAVRGVLETLHGQGIRIPVSDASEFLGRIPPPLRPTDCIPPQPSSEPGGDRMGPINILQLGECRPPTPGPELTSKKSKKKAEKKDKKKKSKK